MKAIILAAGRGSRMKDITTDKPKCMVKVKGKTLIQHQKQALMAGGIKSIAVVNGYLANKIDYTNIEKKFTNEIWEKTNMVSSLICAENWLSKYECIVSYADIFYSSDIIKKLGDISSTECDIAISYDINFLALWNKRFENPLEDLENFKMDKNGYLIEIGGRAKNVKEIEGQYMGLLKFFPGSWTKIASFLKTQDIPKLDMTGMISKLLKNNFRIQCVPNTHEWGEVDNESDIKLYE